MRTLFRQKVLDRTSREKKRTIFSFEHKYWQKNIYMRMSERVSFRNTRETWIANSLEILEKARVVKEHIARDEMKRLLLGLEISSMNKRISRCFAHYYNMPHGTRSFILSLYFLKSSWPPPHRICLLRSRQFDSDIMPLREKRGKRKRLFDYARIILANPV